MTVTNGCRNARRQTAGENAVATKKKERYPQVLLTNVARIFEQVTKETNKIYWQPRSAITTHLVCMRAAGWRSVDYETLMTLSGFGVSFAYEPKDKFWVSYVPPHGGDERITQATGFGWEWLHLGSADQAWTAVKKTLDARKPIRAPYLEDLVIAGYQAAARKLHRKVYVLCVPFAESGQWWTWRQFVDWFNTHSRRYLARHTKRVKKVAARQIAIEVMENIVGWAQNNPMANSRVYSGVRFGIEGIEAYAADIADTSKDESYFHQGWLGCHNIYPQWTARKCTAMYLKQAAKKFASKVSCHLLAATREYKAAYGAWQKWESHLGRKDKAPKGAWQTKTHRRAGAVAVRKALEHEKSAIAEVAAALALVM